MVALPVKNEVIWLKNVCFSLNFIIVLSVQVIVRAKRHLKRQIFSPKNVCFPLNFIVVPMHERFISRLAYSRTLEENKAIAPWRRHPLENQKKKGTSEYAKVNCKEPKMTRA